MDLRFYLSLFLRRLHYFLIIFALGSVIGLTLARILPPVYVATALLVGESEQMPDSLAASTVQADTMEQLQIIQQRILSRQNLIDMSNRLGIYAGSENRPAVRLPADEIVKDMRKRITIVTNAAGSSRDRQVTLISVSFEAETAQMAATVANELVTMILRESVTMRTGMAGQTLEFFTDEVTRLDQALARIGARILEFKQENFEALPDSLDFRRSRLAAQQERLRDIEREEAGLKERRNRLVTIYEATGRVDAGQSDRRMTPEEQRLDTLRRERDTALLTLSPQNPRIRMLDAQIEAQEKAVAAAGGGGADPGMSAYEVQLADIDGQLEFLAQRREDIAADMEELERNIAATPGNAIALGALERDYANVQSQYNQAVANKARAETGDTIESMSRGQRISVIEQAVAPREPTRPNRPLIAAVGIGGGFAGGLGLVLLLELLNRSIRRPQDLVAGLGITPFATLPLLRNEREIRRRRIKIALAFLFALVVIPAALWLVHSKLMPLDLLADQALRKLKSMMQSGGQS